jgi:hypothetical protein
MHEGKVSGQLRVKHNNTFRIRMYRYNSVERDDEISGKHDQRGDSDHNRQCDATNWERIRVKHQRTFVFVGDNPERNLDTTPLTATSSVKQRIQYSLISITFFDVAAELSD